MALGLVIISALGVDVGADVGVDVGVDVGFSVGVDVGLDVGLDVGADVGGGTCASCWNAGAPPLPPQALSRSTPQSNGMSKRNSFMTLSSGPRLRSA